MCCPSVAVGAPDLQGLSDLSSGSEPALGFRLRRLENSEIIFLSVAVAPKPLLPQLLPLIHRQHLY